MNLSCFGWWWVLWWNLKQGEGIRQYSWLGESRHYFIYSGQERPDRMISEQWPDKKEMMRHMVLWRKNIQSKENNRCKESRECLVYSTFKCNKGWQGWHWEGKIQRDDRQKISLLFPCGSWGGIFLGCIS